MQRGIGSLSHGCCGWISQGGESCEDEGAGRRRLRENKYQTGRAAVWFRLGGRSEKRKNVMAECVGLWRPKIKSPGGEE